MRSRIRLRHYDNSWYRPGRSFLVRALWLFLGQPLFRSPLLPFSRLRVALLRLFGANVGTGVVIHSEVVVKYPWHLTVGDDCWIGERAWIDCLTTVRLGTNVCLSQGVYLCTGNHDWGDPAFGLRIEPIRLADGAWVGAQSTLLPGSSVGTDAMLTAGGVLAGCVPEGQIFGGNPARYVRDRVVRETAGPKPMLVGGGAMRVLLMNQFFWPEAAATSQLLTDVARQLVAEGHEVHVICGTSGYSARQGEDRPDVTVHRVAGRKFSRSTLGRVLSYANFYVFAAWRELRVPRPDVVMTLTTPPLLSLLGNLLKLVRGSRHVIWEMDMYPDVATDLNYFRKGGVLDRVVGWLADGSRAYADTIIALGECMRDRLLARGVPAAKIEIAENWADSTAIPVLPKQGDPDKFVLLYSGNLGLAHDLDTITGAMRVLRDDPRFSFVFVGSGGRRKELANFAEAEGLRSVHLRPYVERAGLAGELAQGDVGLVLQSDACCGSIVPSKVYGLLAAGRPLLFVGPAAATPARIIRRFGCGWHVACGDVPGLVALLQRLALAPEEVQEASRRAREALLQHFDLPLGTARITALLSRNCYASAAEACTSV